MFRMIFVRLFPEGASTDVEEICFAWLWRYFRGGQIFLACEVGVMGGW